MSVNVKTLLTEFIVAERKAPRASRVLPGREITVHYLGDFDPVYQAAQALKPHLDDPKVRSWKTIVSSYL